MPRATLGPAALLLSTAAGGNRALVASSGPISPRPSAMSVEDLGVLVDVLGAWAYATGYGPPFTCPVPLTSYSTPSRVAPCGCGRQALESLAGPRWTRQEPNLVSHHSGNRWCSHNRTHGPACASRSRVRSCAPVIAGAKLRESTTTIMPRGRALQGVGLSSMRLHPIGGGPEDDKDGQEAWFTAGNASLIGETGD